MPLDNDPTDQCGYKAFSLPDSHPFTPACKAHDDAFVNKTISRNLADTKLLEDMLAIAKEKKSFKLKAQAYLLYALARTFGKLFW